MTPHQWGALEDPYVFHFEGLLFQSLHSQDVLYGNAAQSALSWKTNKQRKMLFFSILNREDENVLIPETI